MIKQRGYLLISVVVTIFIISAVALMMSQESVMESNRANKELDNHKLRYITEAAMQHALWGINNSGCSGNLTLPTTPFGNGSYSATVTSGITTSSYTLNASQDTWLKESSPAENHGGDIELSVKAASGDNMRALYQFDISPIPAGSQIGSAIAWFYVAGNDDKGAVDIHETTAVWAEGSADWTTLNDKFDSSVIASIPVQDTSDVWVQLNLTSLVQGWVNGSANNGIMLLANSDAVESKYSSSEVGASQQPRIEVVATSGTASPVSIITTGTLTGNPSPANDITRILTRTNIPAYQSGSDTLLQPGAASGNDAEIWDQAPGNNYGDAAETWVSSASNDTTRSLLHFNMSEIPFGARILEAALSLHRQSGSGADQPVSAHRIRNSWSEDSVTWNSRKAGTNWDTAGGDFDNTAVATTPVGPVNQRYEWNIMQIVQGWVDGSYPNYGVVLVAAIAGMPGERFYTSDHADPTLHPKLSITHACECGVSCLVPQGSGNVLFVVVNEWGMTADELAKKALFESWGYTVNLISQWDVAWNYNNLAADNDVAYVSESVDDTAWGLASGLAASTIGVVNEEGAINDDLGTSGSYSYNVGKDMDVIDNSHYITSLFPAGRLPIYSASMEGLQTTGTMATDLQSLGNFNSMTGLAVVETGGLLADGSSIAAGRRVMLPIGRSGSFSLDYLNNNGRLIVQRALEWGAGNDDVCTDGNFRDQFDVIAFNNSDGSLDWSGDWVEIDSTASGAFSGKLLITTGELRINGPSSAFVNPATGVTLYDPSLTRELDLSVYQSATLSFSFRTGSGVDAVEDSAVVEISDDSGTSWTILEDFNTAAGETMGVRSYDITPYLSANTQVRFRINSAYGGPNEYFYVDNVNITAGCSPPAAALPIAHWKLDDATGIIALDSEGGHDGTLINGPIWAAGQLEGALDFDGINDAIRVLHNDALSLTETLTISAWIKPDLISGGYKTVLAKDDSSGNSNYWFGLWQDELVFGFFSGGFFREVFTNGLNIQAGIWQHIAVSFNNSTDEVRLYLDGAMVHTGVLTYSPTAVIVDLGIARSPAAGEFWNGLLDDIRIYDQVLPPSELSTLSAGGGSVEPPPTVDTCDGTFRDEFTTQSYANNDGSLNWSTDWLEINEADGPLAGDEVIGGSNDLRIQDDDGDGEGVQREADLSGSTTATLTYTYKRSGLDKVTDYVTADVSDDGGSTWDELTRYVGKATDSAPLPASFDISSHISANTRIRFLSSKDLGGNDKVYFDNVQIECSP